MKKLITYIIFLFGIVISLELNAQGGPPPPPGGGPGGGTPPCWPPPCVPIDGGITFLLAAGAIYGTKKIYDINKKAEQ